MENSMLLSDFGRFFTTIFTVQNMGLYSKIPGFCGAPWVVGAPRIVTTFHPTSNGPAYVYPCEKTCLS